MKQRSVLRTLGVKIWDNFGRTLEGVDVGEGRRGVVSLLG